MNNLDITQLYTLLAKFGLAQDESSIYLHLLERGSLTALQLSRDLNIGRTKVYNLIEKLIKKGLIDEELSDLGKKYEANDPKILELEIIEEEEKLDSLARSLELVKKDFQSLKSQSAQQVDIKYYSGVDGLKQITWNSLHAKKELFIFEVSQGMHPFTGRKFAEKARQEFYLRRIVTNQLTNIKKFKPFTEVEKYVKYCMKLGYIDPKELELDFEIVVYNNVVAFYTYEGKEIFGTEIYNKDIADMHKQIFNFFWKKGKKMKVGKGGEATVI